MSGGHTPNSIGKTTHAKKEKKRVTLVKPFMIPTRGEGVHVKRILFFIPVRFTN